MPAALLPRLRSTRLGSHRLHERRPAQRSSLETDMQLQDKADGWRGHPTAEVSELARIGSGTLIWRNVHVREQAQVGRQCVLGAGAYIGVAVTVGNRCKIENY